MDITQINNKLEKILPTVEFPGRYTGGEFNQVKKDWTEINLRVALLFPEIYDLGMSNLGLMILYDLINNTSTYLAERAFVPWTDMEKAMRAEDLPLYSLESKNLLSDFDILAVSLPYESLYTNFLNALDLARIPLLSTDRNNNFPLLIAGGHAVFNPEPIAPFVDAIVVGEGEEIILEILDVYANLPEDLSRLEALEQLINIEGLYIPSFYIPKYHEAGIFSHLEKTNPSAPDSIVKRIV